MASVIFFRAANVGLHQRFQPALLARELAEFGVVNLGAVGTFVVREKINAARLREEILRRLPFKTELMVCTGSDVLKLIAAEPFQNAPTGKDITRYVSVLAKAPRPAPHYPIFFPDRENWELNLVRIIGPFVICVRRPGKRNLYPNAVAEKHFGSAATTRNWNTFEKLGKLLAQD